VVSSSPDAVIALELRHIADALEAIRGELAGIAHAGGSLSSQQPK
jgi:hypothetical protein